VRDIKLSHRLRTLLLLSTIASIGWSTPLIAQTPAPVAATADLVETATTPEGGADGEILVTARRRTESSQDVPIALSVVGAEQLDRTGDFTLRQIQQLVPTLQVFSFNPRNTNINIRGLGSNVALTNDGLENGVGFYVDGVYYGRPGQSQFDLVDLKQIEVLRGPQGTLFGKNTTAGAINITTQTPSFTPEFSGEANLGDFNYHQVRASISGPVVPDRLAVRLSVADTHRDGFLTNRFNGSLAQDYDNFTIRGQLLFTPTSRLSFRVIGDWSNQNQRFVLNVPVGYFTTYANGAAIPNTILQRAQRANYALLPANPFARIGDSDSPYQARQRSYGVSGEVNWTLGNATLTSITAYRWWDWDPANDGDGTGLPVTTIAQQVNRQRQFSEEVRLASNGYNRIDYVVGAYYFWQTVRGYGTSAYGAAAANWFLPTVPASVSNAALNGFRTDSISIPNTKSVAVFGQADWHITSSLTLTGGVRYTHEDKDGIFSQAWTGGTDITTLPPALQPTVIAIRNGFNPRASYTVQSSDDSVSGLVTLNWKPARDILLYATYSHGSKSGGLNLTQAIAAPRVVRPEAVDNYEGGFKTQLFDRKVTWNGAIYLTIVSDYQAAITELGPPVLQYIANIPRVRSRGVETDVSFAPTRHVNLTGSLAYTDATYRVYTNAPQSPEQLNLSPTQDLSGAQLAGIPKFTYSLGADLAQPIGRVSGRDAELYAHGDFSHRSSFNTSSTNSLYAQVPAYGVLNVRAGLRIGNGLWDMSIWARNVTNENYYQTLSATNFGYVTGILGEPRTIGGTFRTRF